MKKNKIGTSPDLASAERKIRSIMNKESIDKITIERQDLPEIFKADLLEISKHDGLPVLKPVVISYLKSKGISFDNVGNSIKLKKVKIEKSQFLKIVLSYFHTRIGTSVFYSFPKAQLDKEMSDRLYDIMTQQKEEESFTHSFESLKIINFYFQIKSEWARGKREMVMISIIINQQISPEIEESMSSLCKRFSEAMQSEEDIFTGFYIKDIKQYEEDKARILKNESIIKKMVRDLYWETLEETKKKSEEEKITLLLNDQYIFESLEKMSKKVKIISSEITKFENPPKATSDIRIAISDLNRIIDDLYDGFMEKMASLEIENEKVIPYCKHCGAELPKGQTICHICGNKIT